MNEIFLSNDSVAALIDSQLPLSEFINYLNQLNFTMDYTLSKVQFGLFSNRNRIWNYSQLLFGNR